MIKQLIFREDIRVLNMCVPNNRASNCVTQKLIELQGEIGEFTIIWGDFNTPSQEWTYPARRKLARIWLN